MDTDALVSLFDAAEAHAEGANERLFAALYQELHRLAERQLGHDAGIGITPTTLLHETYLGIAKGHARFSDRGQFMSYAARAMRSLIIDFARQQRAQKRGALFHITKLSTQIGEQYAPSTVSQQQLTRLSEALDELALHDPRLAEVVDLKYFCGFSFAEIAAMRGVAERTVQRDWDKARIYLYRELDDASESAAGDAP